MTKRLVFTVGVVGVAALLLAACGSDSSDSSGGDAAPSTTATSAGTGSSSLDGSTFTSTSVMGHDLVAGSAVSLSFDDGQMTVVAGCNTIGGAYSVTDDVLAFVGQARSTMMGCPEDLMAQDQWLITLFTDGLDMSRTGSFLTLTARPGGDVSIEFAAEGANVASALVGPTWTLESTSDGGTSSSVPASIQAPTLVFEADGTVNVFAGCNTGGTTVATTGDTMTFTPMRLTRMACDDPAMSIETTVTSVLDGALAYTLDGNQLVLTRGTSALTFAGN